MITCDTRESEQVQLVKGDIRDCIIRYERNPEPSGRRTLILFPGGMGSQLLRAQTPYRDDGTPQQFNYDNYWPSPLSIRPTRGRTATRPRPGSTSLNSTLAFDLPDDCGSGARSIRRQIYLKASRRR